MHLRVVPVLAALPVSFPGCQCSTTPGEDPVDTSFVLSGLEQQVRDSAGYHSPAIHR